jgi:hypothetical protein
MVAIEKHSKPVAAQFHFALSYARIASRFFMYLLAGSKLNAFNLYGQSTELLGAIW